MVDPSPCSLRVGLGCSTGSAAVDGEIRGSGTAAPTTGVVDLNSNLGVRLRMCTLPDEVDGRG